MSELPCQQKPDSARVCFLCGNGQNTEQSAMGRFMQNGEQKDAHLGCADKHNLFAIDQWAEANE